MTRHDSALVGRSATLASMPTERASVERMPFERRPHRPSLRLRPVSLIAAAGAGMLALSACSGPTVPVEAAPHAQDPACAEVMLALPETIGDHDQRATDSQATSVWGNPSRVVIRCGVEPPGPSPEHCVSADGVDWLAIEEDPPNWRLLSYGREPAVEVLLDVDEVPSSTVMLATASAVEHIEQTRECTATDQEIEGTDDEVDVESEDEGHDH